MIFLAMIKNIKKMLLNKNIKRRNKIWYSQVAKFRNAQYKLCNFSDLKIIDNPEPKCDKEEGYDFSATVIQDPNNVYNKSVSMNVAIYNKKLHQSYRTYFFKEDYDTINVFAKEIFHVDLIKSVVSLSYLNNINFNACNFDNVIFNEVHFRKSDFSSVNFFHGLMENCLFDHVKFSAGDVNKFIHTIFVDIKFNNNLWERVWFSNCIFINCTFTDHYFYQCDINSQFINCNFVDLKLLWCTTPGAKEYNFNLNHFKALCQNCQFE